MEIEYIGKTLKKDFSECGILSGVVKSYDSSAGLFEIVYADGDSEELEFSEVVSLLEENGVTVEHGKAEAELAQRKPLPGGKPKKRRQVELKKLEMSCELGNSVDNLVNDPVLMHKLDIVSTVGEDSTINVVKSNDELELNLVDRANFSQNGSHQLNLNVSTEENWEESECIDLNLIVEDDMVEAEVTPPEKDCDFDLNLGFKEENKDHCVREMKDSDAFQIVEEISIKETCLFVEETHIENSVENTISIEQVKGEDLVKTVDTDSDSVKDISETGSMMDHEHEIDIGRLYKGKTRGRKRRKLLDNFEPAKEPGLRRSNRRGSAVYLNSLNDHIIEPVTLHTEIDAPSSHIISVASEEKLVASVGERPEKLSVPIVKLKLPPSSQNLNISGVPIVDIFSIYSFLRSFSYILFLSPFELEDFVSAFTRDSANLLFDFIHVSILQTLRKHLEVLSEEGSSSASYCLRCLDWDLLDMITWPLFAVEYLLIHGPALRPDIELSRLRLFECDYYTQPAHVKIELLRCLCDDVIEAESIRSEINRRSSAAELDLGYDQNVNMRSGKNKRVSLSEDAVDEINDWNSDECCLCKMEGSLICCDGCPAAYHTRCVGVASNLLPDGEWYCPECLIDKDKPWKKPCKSLRGAELLGHDPHGRFYYSSCGYLLVLESFESESSMIYYHRNDLNDVMQVLKLSDIRFGGILNMISKHWDIPVHCSDQNSNFTPQNQGLCSDVLNTVLPAAINNSRNSSLMECSTTYMNYYCFAHAASLVAEELMRKSSGKLKLDPKKAVEEIMVMQMTIISKKYSKFYWTNIRSINTQVRNENCGWCYSCKAPEDGRDCLLKINNAEGFKSDVADLQSKVNTKGYLGNVICHILWIEDRLRGLLLGPWLNPHYSKHWRESLLNASNVESVKKPLLILESNLRHRALSADWLKHVDAVVVMGSASHIVSSSVRMASKLGLERKGGNDLDFDSMTTSKAASGLTFYWWRGGRISRPLFSWKVLPCKLSEKAARQSGCTKIPGILYSDNSEYAKRNKIDAWRAAVERLTSTEQLAFLVRDFNSNIRWVDIENTHPLCKKGEFKNSMRSFKKVLIRRKSVEGTLVKYLLDFGKRRIIPEIVVKHGSIMLEESSTSERKKFWLEESHVPLHLLNSYEEKRIARKVNKTNLEKDFVGCKVKTKPSRNNVFLYLFSRAETSESQCGHCNKVVLIREAVRCQYCEGFFHKKHVKKSIDAKIVDCKYTCHKCQEGKHMKINTKKRKVHAHFGKKASVNITMVKSKNSNKPSISKQSTQSQNKKAAAIIPLRRSARKLKLAALQKKKPGRPKKEKQVNTKKNISKKTKTSLPLHKKRTHLYRSYWLGGLLLSKKPNDEKVMQFRSKVLLQSEDLDHNLDSPKCSLCSEMGYTSTLNYINCEMCGDWFHGDAFGLNSENISCVIGFRCHVCRKKAPPLCPHSQDMQSYNKTQSAKPKSDVDADCIMGSIAEKVYLKRKSHLEHTPMVFDSNQRVHMTRSKKQKRDATENKNLNLSKSMNMLGTVEGEVKSNIGTGDVFCKSGVGLIETELESRNTIVDLPEMKV